MGYERKKMGEMEKKILVGVVFLSIIAFFAFQKYSENVEENEHIEKCHKNVQNKAKNYAEIISTNVKKYGENLYSINGTAKFQNGFGAWSRYSYSCNLNSKESTNVKIDKL